MMAKTIKSPTSKPTQHEFTLVLRGVEVTEEVANALYDAGCDDGTLASRGGRAFISFARCTASFAEAVLSAIEDVRKVAGVEVVQVDMPDLVTEADLARQLGRSRQSMHQLVAGERGPGGFPPPVRVLGKSKYWSWSEAAQWLSQHQLTPETVLQEAQQVAVINAVLTLGEQGGRNPELVAEATRRLKGPGARRRTRAAIGNSKSTAADAAGRVE